MVGESKPESVGKRFETYIEELREFFTTRDVPFGRPENLSAFAVQVMEPGSFQDEMGSMVRSILYREDEHLGRGELLELITTAVGGSDAQGAAPGEQSAVRQIFLFVNAALRQRQASLPEVEEEDDRPLVAGDFLAPRGATADPAWPQPATPPAASLRTGDEGRPKFAEPVRRPLPAQPVERAAAMPLHTPAPSLRPAPPSAPAAVQPAGREVFHRAMALSAEEPAAVPLFEEPSRETLRQRWIVPAIACGLAVIGAGVYLTKPGTHRRDASTAALSGAEPTMRSGPACVAPLAEGATISGLEERSRWARNLLNQGLYSAALPEIREIARLDPGFPGIKLDESDALLHMKRPDDAREAVDAQIATSECLAKLPAPALEAYCSVQFPSANQANCRPQLAHVRQAAELQAALVHLELGHQVEPDTGAAAALAELNQEPAQAPKVEKVRRSTASALPKVERPAIDRPEPLPPATEGDTAQPPLERTVPARAGAKRSGGEDSLVRGEGTDSVYGAYQKPQPQR